MYAAIDRHRTGKEEIKIKAKALRAAQRRLTQLQAENDWLRWEHQLIAELCKGFDWFRQLKLRALLESDLELMQLDSQQLTPNDVQQQLPSCLTTDYETRLLQQLSSLPDVQLQSSVNAVADLALEGSNPLQERSNSSASASSSRDHCPASSQSSEQPIAPSYDPLYLFQLVFSKPPSACCNNVEAMTLDQLRAHYKALVRDLSLYLMQHQTGGMAADDQPLDKIQAALVDHLHLVAELCFAGGDLVMSLQLSNCETGEQLAEPPTERIRWVLKRLTLSPQQQHGIARGMSVFKKLLTPVLEELRQMQQQQVDECALPSAAEPATSGGTCSGGASDAAQQYIISGERGRVLEQQQKRSGRMQILLHKDVFLRTWFTCYLYGQLSWVQLARMHVLMLPFYPTPCVFFREVAAQVAAQLAQRGDDEEINNADVEQINSGGVEQNNDEDNGHNSDGGDQEPSEHA